MTEQESKSEFLQIRISKTQKQVIQQLAAAHGQDISSYVLSQALNQDALRFAGIIAELLAHETADPEKSSITFSLNALNRFLNSLSSRRLAAAIAVCPGLDRLNPFIKAYVAAMVEVATLQKKISAPLWTSSAKPLRTPYFASKLPGLRFHLLLQSPLPFKRRNLFIDTSIGGTI